MGLGIRVFGGCDDTWLVFAKLWANGSGRGNNSTRILAGQAGRRCGLVASQPLPNPYHKPSSCTKMNKLSTLNSFLFFLLLLITVSYPTNGSKTETIANPNPELVKLPFVIIVTDDVIRKIFHII
ncbi:SNF2-family ATP dependent chromatin remodeling factor snf21, partial [Striga asiatica]